MSVFDKILIKLLFVVLEFVVYLIYRLVVLEFQQLFLLSVRLIKILFTWVLPVDGLQLVRVTAEPPVQFWVLLRVDRPEISTRRSLVNLVCTLVKFLYASDDVHFCVDCFVTVIGKSELSGYGLVAAPSELYVLVVYFFGLFDICPAHHVGHIYGFVQMFDPAGETLFSLCGRQG